MHKNMIFCAQLVFGYSLGVGAELFSFETTPSLIIVDIIMPGGVGVSMFPGEKFMLIVLCRKDRLFCVAMFIPSCSCSYTCPTPAFFVLL